MAIEFQTMSKQGQWGVIGVLCLVLVGVFYRFSWSGQAELSTRLSGEIQQMQLDNQRTRQIAGQLPQLEAELAVAEGQLATLSNILPESQRTDSLLRSLEQASTESNLVLRRTSYPAVITHDFYAELPMELDLVGSYHDLALFFDRISKFGRVVTVGQVTISALTDGSPNTIQAQCTASTFFFLPDVEPPAEGAEGTTTPPGRGGRGAPAAPGRGGRGGPATPARR